MALQDSGSRTVFESGAVREMETGKGRTDLLPWGTIGAILKDPFMNHLEVLSREPEKIVVAQNALYHWACLGYNGDFYEMLLEVAKQYEDGAAKYSPRNWQKGLPLWSFVDSLGRHYLKWRAHQTDEPHDRAITWNLLGLIWTIEQQEKEKVKE